jgi:hypothetical protein
MSRQYANNNYSYLMLFRPEGFMIPAIDFWAFFSKARRRRLHFESGLDLPFHLTYRGKGWKFDETLGPTLKKRGDMMYTRCRRFIYALILTLFLAGCGGGMPQPTAGRQPEAQVPATATSPAEMLPETIGTTGWVRGPELQRFVGESLFDYIDGAADMYHRYDFVEVHVADYHKGTDEIVADLYAFAGADKAYGMFTTLRPMEPDTVAIGIEGFLLMTNLIFVKGDYIVNLATYDDSESGIAALRQVASTIERGLPGTAQRPATFALFPEDGRLAHSEKIYAESYLGLAFLNDVYTVDVTLPEGSFTLFASDDSDGEKFRRWAEKVSQDEVAIDPAGISELPFDAGRVLATSDSYHGLIVAGTKAQHLIGIVGYSPEHKGFLRDWLTSLP